jgi:hypothetical protein
MGVTAVAGAAARASAIAGAVTLGLRVSTVRRITPLRIAPPMSMLRIIGSSPDTMLFWFANIEANGFSGACDPCCCARMSITLGEVATPAPIFDEPPPVTAVTAVDACFAAELVEVDVVVEPVRVAPVTAADVAAERSSPSPLR